MSHKVVMFFNNMQLSKKIFFGGGALLLLLILPFIIASVQKQQNESVTAQTAVLYPTSPPVHICGNTDILTGPTNAPPGAIIVPAGDNSKIDFSKRGTIYWFASGTHTIGTSQYNQIDPGDNATFMGASGAVLDGQGKNRYAFAGTATGVTVKYLTIKDFGQGSSATTPSGDNNNEGVVNHNPAHNWTIQYNTIEYNAGAGVFVGSNNVVTYNCLTKNGQYGFSSYEPNGISNINVSNNEISFNNTYNWEAKIDGCGCTGGGKFWNVNKGTFINNYIHDNYSVGMWADTNNRGFDIEGNYFANNTAEAIIYEISYNALIKNNTFIGNAVQSGQSDPGFPHAAVYISESGSDSRVAGSYGTSFQITGNFFNNNWGGVVLWENANRYCSSSANTSSGECTLVNPNANLKTCANLSLLATKPYIDDCRWKTQNVQVMDNIFQFTPSAISPKCTSSNMCGYNGLFSEYGTYKPYTAYFVPSNIANKQNNIFSKNAYQGPWKFSAFVQGDNVDWAQWTNGFNDQNGSGIHFNEQDAESSFNGVGGPTSPPGVPTTTLPSQQPTTIPHPTSNAGHPSSIPSPAKGKNIFDVNTAGLEGSIGKWANWYSTSVTRTTQVAHTGTHSLQVKVTAPYGWGVQASNWPGFAVTPGSKTISFWALKGTKNTSVTLQLQWMNASQKVLQTNRVTLNSLSSIWQKAQTTINAPAGTKTVTVDIINNASKGTTFYLDDFSLVN